VKVLKILIACVLCFLVIVILYVAFVIVYSYATAYNPDELQNIEVTNIGKEVIHTSNNIQILSWNIGYAGLGKEMDFFYEGGEKVRPEKNLYKQYLEDIKQNLISYKDVNDIIILQEVDIHSKRSYFANQFEIFSQLLSSHTAISAINYQSSFVPVPWLNPMGKVRSGLATYSKYQPIKAIRYSTLGNYFWPKSMFMLKRCILFTSFNLDNNKELILLNIHNSAFEDEDELRELELKLIMEVALEEYQKGNYVIIGGDWNQNPPNCESNLFVGYKSKVVRPIHDDFLPGGWHWSFDPVTPTNRDVNKPFDLENTHCTILDYFVLSPNIDLIDIETIDLGFEFSDHNPVNIKIRLNQ